MLEIGSFRVHFSISPFETIACNDEIRSFWSVLGPLYSRAVATRTRPCISRYQGEEPRSLAGSRGKVPLTMGEVRRKVKAAVRFGPGRPTRASPSCTPAVPLYQRRRDSVPRSRFGRSTRIPALGRQGEMQGKMGRRSRTDDEPC